MVRIGRNLLLFLFFLTSIARADTAVVATVDDTEVAFGDSIGFTISVRSTDSVDIDEPAIGSIPGFEIQPQGSATSFSTRMVPGQGGMQFQSQRQKDFRYQLIPQREGTLSIPAVSVVVDGKTYSTAPVVITVVPSGGGTRKNAPTIRPMPNIPAPEDIESEMDEAEQLFNQLLQRQGIARPSPRGGSGSGGGSAFVPKNEKESFLIHVDVDKTDVYEGEQVTVNWYIYTRGNILSLERVKFPDLKGFWKEIIEEVPSLNFTQEVINGISYRRALLASHALFPIKPGTVTLDEYKVKASVQIPTSTGLFGFGPTYTFNRSSERIKINVKPLPTEGRPSDFSGAVGNFDMRSFVEGQQFPINQPFAWKIRFDGTGNAKLIELPAIEIPPGLERYDTKSDAKFFKEGRSFKEFQIILIPRQAGPLTLPAVSASMFDPKTGHYYTKKTEPISMTITGATEDGIQSSRVGGKAKPKVMNQLPSPVVQWRSFGWWTSYKAYFVGFIYLIVFALLGWRIRTEFAWGQRKKDLRAELAKRLKKAQSFIKQNQWRSFGTEMTNVMYYILGEVSGQGGASMQTEKLLELISPSIRRELGAELQQLIDRFQVLSFAPEEVVGRYKDPAEMSKAFAQAETTLLRAIVLSQGSVSE